MKLSIAIITMNRAEQLLLALRSCVNCVLPENTEFVIVDNASTDNTKDVIEAFFKETSFAYSYEYEPVNLGVGGGRSRAFDLCRGDYVYFCDDDAVIMPDSYDKFFAESIKLFETDENVATITTRIYDELIKKDRDVICSKIQSTDKKPNIFMFLGGSHFLRKSYFSSPLYMDITYGMEELQPSLYAIDNGWRNCYLENVRVNHQPKVNKWKEEKKMKEIIISYNVNTLCLKQLLYPKIFIPLLFVFFVLRNIKQFKLNIFLHRDSWKCYYRNNSRYENRQSRIKFSTVIGMLKEYSLGTIF